MQTEVHHLRDELVNVPLHWQELVHRKGALSDSELLSLVTDSDAHHTVCRPTHADASHVSILGDITPADDAAGADAMKKGEVAVVVLAGGAGTRMGGPKQFMVIPGVGTSLLAWKLMQCGDLPTWIMTSPRLMSQVADHIKPLALSPKLRGRIFEQFEGYRLTTDDHLSSEILEMPDVPELYPLGHGDVGPALIESGILEQEPNVKWIYVCNVDNVMSAPYEGLVGYHIRHGASVTCEVVDRHPGDAGGVLAFVNGRLQIAEDWRLPAGFADKAAFHNTNSMLFDVGVLKSHIDWRWHRVQKHVDGRNVVQYERLIQQYTEEFGTVYVRFPRWMRYTPVKTPADLEVAGQAILATKFQ